MHVIMEQLFSMLGNLLLYLKEDFVLLRILQHCCSGFLFWDLCILPGKKKRDHVLKYKLLLFVVKEGIKEKQGRKEGGRGERKMRMKGRMKGQKEESKDGGRMGR